MSSQFETDRNDEEQDQDGDQDRSNHDHRDVGRLDLEQDLVAEVDLDGVGLVFRHQCGIAPIITFVKAYTYVNISQKVQSEKT